MKIYVLSELSECIKCVSENITLIRKCICKEFNPSEDYPVLSIYEDGIKIKETEGSDVLKVIAREINNINDSKVTMEISEKKLDEMFERYINKRVEAARSSGYNEGYCYGEADECRKWLEMFGVDMSYERVEPIIEAKLKH